MERITMGIYPRKNFVFGILFSITSIIIVFFQPVFPAWATQPPEPGEIERLKASGLFQERLKFVKGTGNHKFHPGLVEKLEKKLRNIGRESKGLMIDEPVISRGQLPPERYGMPSIGTVKTFAILIEFTDTPHTVSHAVIDSMLFGNGNIDNYPRESLANYYDRSSLGQLDLSNGHTFPWYQTSYGRDSVVPLPHGRENLIKEVLTHYDQQGHDFSQYDNDNDGYIDYFMVFWTGAHTGWGSFWWAYQAGWSDGMFFLDGKRLRAYSWQMQSDFPSTVIHETGHGLGLPDYYDYEPDDGIGPNGGLGNFDMMDSSTGDHNCFSKWMLDWVTPTAVGQGEQTIVLPDSKSSGDCVLIWPGVGLEDNFSEFYLVENRQYTENDESLWFKVDGLSIWHVDSTLDSGHFAFNNSNTWHKLIKLMEADGLEEIENSWCVDPPEDPGVDPYGHCRLRPERKCEESGSCKKAFNSDLYGEDDQFIPESTPSSDGYDGLPTGVRIWDIRDHGDLHGASISAIFSIVPSGNCGQPPQPVQLLLPENGAVDVSTTPHIGWTSQYGIAGYLVQICDTDTCENPLIIQQVQLNNWVVAPPLENFRQYWWRVKARNFCVFGDWSPIYTFTTKCPTLETPTPVIPSDGVLDVSTRPTLNWSEISGSETYTVQVCENQSCSSIVREETLAANQWIVYPELDVGTTYYWRARANNFCGFGIWSTIRAFTTTCASLEHPSLLSPPYGSTDRYPSLTMDWADLRHAVDYVVEVCEDEACTVVIQEHTTEESSWSNTWDPSSTYWWRLKARNACGESPWSPAWVFSTEFVPDPPQLVVPTDGATGVSPLPFLDWQPVQGAVQYQVFVRDCDQDSQCTVSTGFSRWVDESRLTLTSPLDKGDFQQWFVTAHGENSSGENSEKWIFRVCEDPSAPVLSSPADGAADVAIPTVLDWSPTPGADSYDVQVCGDDRCTNVLRSENVAFGDQWTVSPGLSANTGYYWRVKANNACGESWSSKWSFTTTACPAPTFQPYIKAPVDGQTGVSILPTLEWQGSGAGMPTYFGPFEVWVCSDTHCKNPVLQQADIAGWSYTPATVLDQNTAYWWQVRAANICGQGPWSTRPGFTTGDCTALGAPTISSSAKVVDSNEDYTVEWNSVRDASDYTIQESTDPSFTQTDSFTQSGITKTFNHTVNGCSPLIYYYRVRANKSGCDPGEWSNVVDMEVNAYGTLVAPVPASPADNAGEVSLTPTLDWDDTADAAFYQVEVCEISDCSSVAQSSKVSESTWTVPSSLSSGTDYWWRVKAYGTTPCNDSDWSAIWQFKTSCKPNAPVLQDPGETVASGQTYTISWNEVPGADRYTVWESRNVEMYRATSYSSSKTSLKFIHTNNRCVPVTWFYVVQAVASGCPVGELSNVVDMEIDSLSAPGAPDSLNYPVGDCAGNFSVNWTSAPGAGVYFLERSPDQTFTNSQTVYSGDSNVFSETDLPGGTYYYRVKAVNGCGESSWVQGSSISVGGPVPGVAYVGTGDCNGNCPCHPLLDSALDLVVTPGTIYVMEGNYQEDFSLHTPKELELMCWDSVYSAFSEATIYGNMDIGDGCVILEGGCFILAP